MQVQPLKNTNQQNSDWSKIAKTYLNYALIALLASLILNPILEARVNSAYLVVFITLLGGAIGTTRFRLLVVISAWLLAFSYAALSLTPLAKHLAPHFIVTDPLPTKADAIIVLSAESPYSNVVKSQGLERLLHGKDLLEKSLAPTLVLTNLLWYHGNPDKDRQFLLGDSLKNTLSIGPVENTYDEAQALKKLASERGWKEIILVTSPLHSRRAKAIFSEQLPELTIISSPCAAREFDLDLLVSSYDKLKVSRLMLYEVAAWGKNFILGRL